jgi:signal transduction histidine kinase
VNAHVDKATLIATLLGLSLACFVIHKSRREYRRWNNPVDLAMCMVASVWLFHLVALRVLLQFGAEERAVLAALCIRDQTLTVAIAMLLVGLANVGRRRTYQYLVIQMSAGSAVLTWALVTDAGATPITETWAYRCWVLVNLVGTAVLAYALARRAQRSPTNNTWLALAGAVLICVLWMDGLKPAEAEDAKVTFTQLFYAVCLASMWYLSKLPAGNARMLSSGFMPTTGFDMLSGFAPGTEEMTMVIAHERRRIAHDLHDNVGSQLVNILASLKAPGATVDESLSVALEQCLMDLKMTVDVIDGANDNVPEALGRVRQRAQHALDTMGMHMAWRVQMCEQLEAARGPIAVQILRIAQEGLANIIRHSGATAVEVACRYDDRAEEIILEIFDNGIGIAPTGGHGRPGRGLDNMRQRAAALQGKLFISSKVRGGTHLRLSVPFDMRRAPWEAVRTPP